MRRIGAALGALSALATACGGPAGAELPVCDPPSVDAQALAVAPGGADPQVIPITCWQQVGHERIRLRFEVPSGLACQRLEELILVESADAIAVSLTVARDPNGEACPAEPGLATTEVDLLSPVGSRRVLDAGRQD
jgi:hypothetical protein